MSVCTFGSVPLCVVSTRWVCRTGCPRFSTIHPDLTLSPPSTPLPRSPTNSYPTSTTLLGGYYVLYYGIIHRTLFLNCVTENVRTGCDSLHLYGLDSSSVTSLFSVSSTFIRVISPLNWFRSSGTPLSVPTPPHPTSSPMTSFPCPSTSISHDREETSGPYYRLLRQCLDQMDYR